LAQKIQGIFVDPPIAIARLGSSNVPLDAYRWVEANNPRTDGNTVIEPTWSLDINGDGSVTPRKPEKLHLRDGDLIRPVAPFFEIWALMGEDGSPPSSWTEERLTPALLAKFKVDESAVTIQIDAKNRKAASRTRRNDLVFGTFPPLVLTADNHDMHTLFGVSPPKTKRPMIPEGYSIPLGSIQIMQSRPQPSGTGWEDEVNVEVMRFRFTPGRGRFYGPKQATVPRPGFKYAAVEESNGYLDDKAGWFKSSTKAIAEPADTYDIFTSAGTGPSLGVVDDTCEVRVDITLTIRGHHRKGRKSGRKTKARVFETHANIFVGPPDFAPDRRPFLSLADELSDRSADKTQRDNALSDNDLEIWVCDLFERVYETLSLLNLDHFQFIRSMPLRGEELAKKLSKTLTQDSVLQPRNHAMTRKDVLRNPDQKVAFAEPELPLPLWEHAKTRHRALQDIKELQELLYSYPGRFEALIREPFEVREREDASTGDVGRSSMRMPPFMRNSNGFPLTLSTWQYSLLMRWLAQQRPIPAAVRDDPDRKLSKAAKARRDAVLSWLDTP
jgi:hypothetical protein